MENKILENSILQNIFQCCLKKEESNNTTIYLELYEKELKENNEELYLLVDNIYFFLLHKISLLHKQKKNCLSYLCSCSVRLLDKNIYKKFNLDKKKIDDLSNEIFDQIINNAITYLENLDIYPNVSISSKERLNFFFEFLKGCCTPRFLKKMLSVIEENDSKEQENGKQLKTFFNPIIELIVDNLNSRSLIYPKNDIAVLLNFITSFKQLADLIMNNKSIFLYLNLSDKMKDNFLEKKCLEKCPMELSYNQNEINSKPVSGSLPTSHPLVGNEVNTHQPINNTSPGTNTYDDNLNSSTSNISINNANTNNRNPNNSGHFQNKPLSKDKEIDSCGYNLQLNSLLGRLLSPTILIMPNIFKKEEIAMYKYFFNTATNSLNKMTLNGLKNTYMLLRKDICWILENCVDIIKNLLKGSAESKKKVLLWLNCIILSNEKKTKIMYHYVPHPQSLDSSYGLFLKLFGENSYGFCMNIFWVLLYLCEPITTNKINDIDSFFF